MLPSRGFFKKIDCPFFEKGLCVRPHCHFRHKKKVICENSSSVDSPENSLLSENLAEFPLVKNDGDESSQISSSSISNKKSQNSKDETEPAGDKSNHDSLFAKLVNQPNPYERVSSHIPCAYTPTPQVKRVQPKNKGVSLKCETNDSKGISSKSQAPFNYRSTNSNENEKVTVSNTRQHCLKSSGLNKTSNDITSTASVSLQKTKFSPENSECKIPFFDNGASECYEPQSTVKSISNKLDKDLNSGNSSDYVPSKVTATAESQYIPNSNDISSSFSYVPSKDKPKESQYVPEPTGNSKNQVTYNPSDVTSAETLYQPESNSCIAKYVPTEKSAQKACNTWLDDSSKNELTEIEFISSEIEMMKQLLKDEENKATSNSEKSTHKTESTEMKPKDEKISHKDRHKSSRSHHSSSHSGSRSRSSHHSHSSKSKSSRSHSSKSSRSDRHRSSSRSHSGKEKGSASSRKSRRHHSSRDSERSKSKKKKTNEDEGKKEHSSKTKATKCSESTENDVVDGLFSDHEDHSEKDESSEAEGENESKKRKNLWTNEERQFKFLKKDIEELFEDLEDDPDTVERECLEIFNSYTSTAGANESKKPNEVTISSEELESTTQAKKRTAHSTVITSDHSVLRQKTSKTVRNSIKSAQEVMLDRYKTIEKAKETQAFQPPPPQPAPILGLNRPSIKIAAVSNIQQMLQAKKAIQEKINKGIKVNERTTIAQTLTPGSSRVAHTPASKEMVDKPIVNGGSKQVPRMKRQIYLEKLLLETNQIYPTKSESAEEALKLEEDVFRANSGSSSAYHAAFVSLLLRTRRRVALLKGEAPKSNAPRTKMSHSDVLAGGKKNFSVLKSKKVDISMLTDRHIYEELLRCKLTPEELKENGFPMESDRPGYASCSLNFELKYNDKYLHIKKMTGNRRYCIRCSKQYEVDPITLKQYKEGPETCFYHPGKKKSGGRHTDRIYNCCNSASSEGCTTHVRHVTDCNDYERLPNCVKTLSKENETNPGVFALDCEMVYTRLGYELARVTVVNLKKEVVYDTLVKPKYPIECYNTFFSGIEEKMMEGVETTLKDVQAVLLSMFSEKTILIGHSLDSDLRALHLIHDTVVDTAIVYKNEKYHPYKYSLKDLCARKISKIIQDSVNGHDSAEDAVAALEIMLNYVKEEVSKYDSLESYEADRMDRVM